MVKVWASDTMNLIPYFLSFCHEKRRFRSKQKSQISQWRLQLQISSFCYREDINSIKTTLNYEMLRIKRPVNENVTLTGSSLKVSVPSHPEPLTPSCKRSRDDDLETFK